MSGGGAEILDSLRSGATARFEAAGWPSPASEAWKFTNLNRLAEREFTPAAGAAGGAAGGAGTQEGGCRLVFNNGAFLAGVSDAPPKGAAIHPLGEDAGLAGLLDHPKLRDHPVADQTLAATPGGIGIRIAGKVEEPIRIEVDADGDDFSTHPVVAVDLAPGAEATILERYGGTGSGLSLPVLAARIGEGARLRHVRVQAEDADRHHLGQEVFTLAGKARYEGLSVQTGAILSRCEHHFGLVGEEAEANLTTLYLAKGEQVMDVTAFVGHEAPSCTSMQVVRGVLDDKARGVFQGKVLVAQDAQHTDGNQMSRALLLSRDCEADAKPELEIYADDVACSHGATVGEIEDDHLFYLMSRGIGDEEARQLLIEAFLADALETIDDEAMLGFAMAPVTAWLEARKAPRAGGAA